jgi:hypothetical protein
MISLDVQSLFTSIPTHRLINCINNNWENISKHTDVDQKLFLNVITFIINNSYFLCNGKYYKQIQGLPMGSCLSPIAAQYVMELCIDEVMKEIGIYVEFFAIFVDDIFMIIDEEEAENSLMCFNNFDNKLKFTIEYENNKQLSFLDTLIKRKDTCEIETDWFYKDCSSQILLNFHSSHSFKQKMNVAHNLIQRITKLTTDFQPKKALRIATEILHKNDYPKSLIRKWFFESLQKEKFKEKPDSVNKKYMKFNNVPILSDKIRKIIKKYDQNIELIFTNTKTNHRLFTQIKDKIDKFKQTQLVYQIKCECDNKYTGLTFKQYLGTRISQHKKDCGYVDMLTNKCNIKDNDIKEKAKISLTTEKETKKIEDLNKLVKACDKSGLTTHYADTGHNFNFNEVEIIGKSDNRFKLGILEMIEIKKFLGVNKNTDTQNLNAAYFGIIEDFSRNKKRQVDKYNLTRIKRKF